MTHAPSSVKPHAEYDVAKGWARLEHRIDLAEIDPTAASALRYEASRHGAAEHIAHVGEGPPMKLIAGGAVVLLLVGGFMFWRLHDAGADFRVTRALVDAQAHAIGTATGERASVKLEDGTQVTMAAEDSITVPKAFNQEFRAVRLRGAARFAVASNPKLPFEVRAGRMQIVATGTTFTVSAYADEPVVVAVQDGEVRVTVGTDVRTVASGAGVTLSVDSVLTVATAEQRDEAAAWADGRFVIADRTLRASLPMFRRWYSMDLRPELQLLDRRVSLSAPIDSGSKALAALERVALVKQIWVRSQMVVVDAPPAAKAPKN
ncbi:MAG: FecR domain-containing protein [Gemmatimonadaceae bacterium]|nr:FecR domain-containing protein [Gemmatimonadaceae bacterium]